MTQQNDFSKGNIPRTITRLAIPMILAMLVNALYSVVDRIYIGHLSGVGQTALTGIGLCYPITMAIAAFSYLVGNGGGPLTSILRGAKDDEGAEKVLGNSITLLVLFGILVPLICFLIQKPVLYLFGASDATYPYAREYITIYLSGSLPVMLTLGLNPFLNAQGFTRTGMMTVLIGAVCNIVLDPLFIFVFGLGIKGAAIATIISQTLSAAFVLYFLHYKAEYRIRFLSKTELTSCGEDAKNIVSLGTAGFIMQLTNSLVTICANNVLSVTGGDVYISVMTIISSVRQMVETPIYAITEGSSPIISYNYGARRPQKVRQAGITMAVLALIYTLIIWSVILAAPRFLIGIFSSDQALMTDTVPAMKLYFAAFIFMLLQYVGQTIFKALNKKKYAIFFSILRKVIIVVPMTYILPYALNMGPNGVFMAEPISNVIGGSLCFIVMLATVLPELKRM